MVVCIFCFVFNRESFTFFFFEHVLSCCSPDHLAVPKTLVVSFGRGRFLCPYSQSVFGAFYERLRVWCNRSFLFNRKRATTAGSHECYLYLNDLESPNYESFFSHHLVFICLLFCFFLLLFK